MNKDEKLKKLKEWKSRIEKKIEALEQENKFDVYEINFNGKIERFYCSKESVSFDDAQSMVKKFGKKTLTVSELWAEDNSGLPRWRLLKDAGCSCWVWCQEYSESSAYFVNLNNGLVLTLTRTANSNALCS